MERVKADAKLLALIAVSFAKQDVNFASSEFNPIGAITNGFTGKVKEIGYVRIEGNRVTPRTAQQGPQVIKFDGKEVILAEVGEMSMTLAVQFEGNKTISLATLNQSPLTKIGAKFIGDYTNKDLAEAIKGKTLKCTAVIVDDNSEVTVPGSDPANLAKRSAKAYHFTVS